MPGKSKEDTWGAKELTESIKEARSSGKSKHRDRDLDKEREKTRDKDKDRHRERDKERDREKDKDRHRDKDKERHRDKEHDRTRDKDRDRHRDKERDQERDRDRDKHREKEKERRKDRENESSKEKDKERRKDRERDSSKEKDKERRKDHGRDSSKEKNRERRKDRERDSSRDKEKSKHREKEKDRDREKKERSHDNRERAERTDSGKKERHRDKDEKRREQRNEGGSRDRDKSRAKDEERDRRREEKRHRDKDRERKREKESHDSDREKRKHRDKDGSAERKKRERSGERKHRKEHREEKDRRKSEYKNGRDERLEEKDKKERRRHENNHEDEDDVGQDIHNAPENNEQNQEESHYAYEDDFEDYDDDFEDDDEEENEDPVMPSEIDNLRRAMAAENEALRRSAESRDSRSQQSSANTRPTTSRTGRTFINFVAAKQREISDQVSQRTKKRGQELMTLIDLDSTGFDIFDMPPVREYDRYIASFGRSNTKQAFVQCNDDNLDRDIQTEEIDKNDRWTQHPQEGSAATGGSNVKEEGDELPLERETNSLQFNRFMENATQLISVLLDEQLANRVGGKLESNKRSIVFSDGYTLMNTGTPILQGRSIVRVVIHPVQTNLIITMHSMPKADLMNIDDKDLKVLEKAGLTNRGLLCVWNINEPSRPQKILVLKSVPTTCTFSPSKATMAFCGTVDGSVCVWDLREPPSMHQKCEFGWGHIMVRVPTYSTEAGCPEESHHSRVVAMQPIVSSDDAQKATSKSNLNDDSVGFSFQLATVDEKGTISFWVVIEIDKPDDAGSESDLGLVPGGRVKLIKSSSIQLQIPTRELGPTYQLKVTDLQLLPSNPNHFFVATDAGFISHGARNTERVSPKYFLTNDGVPVGVKCIDFSPFNLPCFLAANGDGSIQLFSSERGTPLVSWPNSTQGMSIVAISWSRSRPSVFFVMDIASKVYVWELLENDSGPVKTEQFTRGRLSALALANDHAATGWGVAGRKPEMIITDNMGSLDVHVLNSRFSSAIGSELDAFSDLLQQLI
ncbi:cytoplasmic dynein 2 intermediate chain 1-like isoform X1 [Lytechinus pictus]|uniref:cytoplasmic dynein 2 intermediate chain 1-like isoform X1 n=1 Tax=Lytechinus pictus TaxID=7653 RepID=UPI0030B9E437